MNTTPANPSSPPGPTSTGGPGRSRRSFASWLVWSLIVAVLLIAFYTLFLLWWSYSEGERAGVLQKFSKRGWICKTYEGELAMYVVGGIAPQIWNFSVRDEATAGDLSRAVGRQVRLHYTEHPGLPTNCFGETDYFVDGIEIVGPPQSFELPAGVAPPAGPETAPASH